ncbi:hypothetical protein RQN9TF_03235 [Rhodococcus qingshengii]|nr:MULTISPECIES: hypothetical protein [Rhodococcus]BDQ18185.1 hypothetical protein RQN9TF_03235 [Rhodococcus qingshengii]
MRPIRPDTSVLVQAASTVEGDSDAIGGRVSGVTGEQAQPP